MLTIDDFTKLEQSGCVVYIASFGMYTVASIFVTKLGSLYGGYVDYYGASLDSTGKRELVHVSWDEVDSLEDMVRELQLRL